MSTPQNETPIPEAPQEYQSRYLPSYGSQEVPPAPPAPPQSVPSANHGYTGQQSDGYGQPQQPAAPAYNASPAPQPVYYPDSPYQGAQPQYPSQAQQVYQQSVPGYQSYPGYGFPAPLPSPGQQAASNSLTMGIIAAVITFTLGWIPFIGLLGVAGGIGCGIPAILGAKKAEGQGVNATAGKTLGWISVGFSAFWVLLYLFLMAVGAATDSASSSV